ncbi:MAG: HAMP domain-containing histidine kinase [Mariniphaga sp.]|nr:HAMP domain-containing histidine kinase [Mariniphaga sp.]
MKLFSTVLRRKRGVILFVAAFMLPLFFVVVVSIDTFSKRQKTTRSLLESNLWLSGRSALDQLEIQFIEQESKWLDDKYFNDILKNDNLKRPDAIPGIFIIDQDFQVLYPKIAEDKNDYLLSYNRGWNSDFKEYMGRAETAEFTNQNFSDAVKNYKASIDLAETLQQEALAIEGLARSHLSGKNYHQAIKYYQLLKNKYSQTENLGGHPYGISAPLQLYSIGTLIGENTFDRDSLLITYQKIKNGQWLISSSSYFFFRAEYESILKIDTELTDSKFEKTLNFNQFVGGFVIPALKERSGFSEFNKVDETRRIYIQTEEGQNLISFKEMLIPDGEKLYIVGIHLNLDTVINKIIIPKLAGLTIETGLEFLLVNSSGVNILTGETSLIPEESLTLSFTNIPFPWSLVAIQPGYEKLESDAKVQMFIYGLLVVIIIILMFFGAFVLLRDISRESDSMLLQTEFVHNVSHELKTPLSLIRLYSETLLLKEHLPEANRKEGLQIITKESERLSYMINNILDFSKIELGRKEFDLKPGNLAEVVLNTLDLYRYHFVKKGFTVDDEIDPDIPLVLFDKNAVEGILINLFSNAIKFSTDSKKLIVKLKNNTEGISLEVSDKGIGIPPDELPHIFNRFYRVKSTTDFEARGSGLGLTIVKHAVEAHGWKIKVISTSGQGSSFFISIPIKDKKEELD